MTANDIVVEARGWLATPYQHQASLKHVGADCIGFIAGVARNLSIPGSLAYDGDAGIRGYGRQPDPSVLKAGADKYLKRIEIQAATAGDIFVLKFEIDPMHFAIVTRADPLYIIHAVQMRGGVVEHRVDHVWRQRIIRAYRFPGVA